MNLKGELNYFRIKNLFELQVFYTFNVSSFIIFFSSIRLQRLQPCDKEELWAGVEDLWSYRSEKPLYWKILVNNFKLKLQEVVNDSKDLAN